MSRTRRSPAYLAALASSAVPGLDPASARAVNPAVAAEFDVAFVTDTQDRQWVVRVPCSPMAGARMESSVALLALLARRVPFHVPVPKGFADVPEGRAAVYPYLPGTPLRLGALPAGPGLAADLGRAIAALHNVDRRLYEEAELPAYDADSYRTRRLADVDRGAATGNVPTTLLTRWEDALDDVTLWRFAPTPVHGDLGGDQVLAIFSSQDDASTGRVSAITGWEDAKIADPADDLATLVSEAAPAAIESVMEAYVNARTEAADPHLRRRALLSGEMRLLSRLLAASTSGSHELVRRYAAELRRLDDRVDPDDLAPPAPAVVSPKPLPVSAAVVDADPQADPELDPELDPEATQPFTDADKAGLLPDDAGNAAPTQEIRVQGTGPQRPEPTRVTETSGLTGPSQKTEPTDTTS